MSLSGDSWYKGVQVDKSSLQCGEKNQLKELLKRRKNTTASTNSHRWSKRCHVKVDLMTGTDFMGLLSPLKLFLQADWLTGSLAFSPKWVFKTEKSTNQTEQTDIVWVLEHCSRKGAERALKMLKLQTSAAAITHGADILFLINTSVKN